jgi:hypothetical protein
MGLTPPVYVFELDTVGELIALSTGLRLATPRCRMGSMILRKTVCSAGLEVGARRRMPTRCRHLRYL